MIVSFLQTSHHNPLRFICQIYNCQIYNWYASKGAIQYRKYMWCRGISQLQCKVTSFDTIHCNYISYEFFFFWRSNQLHFTYNIFKSHMHRLIDQQKNHPEIILLPTNNGRKTQFNPDFFFLRYQIQYKVINVLLRFLHFLLPTDQFFIKLLL